MEQFTFLRMLSFFTRQISCPSSVCFFFLNVSPSKKLICSFSSCEFIHNSSNRRSLLQSCLVCPSFVYWPQCPSWHHCLTSGTNSSKKAHSVHSLLPWEQKSHADILHLASRSLGTTCWCLPQFSTLWELRRLLQKASWHAYWRDRGIKTDSSPICFCFFSQFYCPSTGCVSLLRLLF